VRLQTPETGVKALFGEVQAARENLAKSIQALETTSEGDALNTRVAALDAGKKEAEQRIVRLEGSYAVLDAVRRDLAELKKRQENLATQLTEVETDPDGKTLNERLAEMDSSPPRRGCGYAPCRRF
jgi:predicted nuclease with TOPRIM domain